MPMKIPLPDKLTTNIIGVLRLTKANPTAGITSIDRLMIRFLQNVIASLLLVYKERAKHSIHKNVIDGFISKRRFW